MAKIIIKDTDKFETIIAELEKTIPAFESAFEIQNNNYNTIDGTESWTGETQRIVISKYNELKRNYEPIKESLINYIKYLKITVENYKKFEKTVDETIDDNDGNLDVN